MDGSPDSSSSPSDNDSVLKLDQPTVIPTAPTIQLPKPTPTPQKKKAKSLPVIERRNWLIHQHYVRNDSVSCKSLIKEQLKETKGQCEYAIYIQAMLLRNEGEIQNSLELFQACHMLNPTNPDNLKQVARNLVLQGKHKGAIECYNKAAELGQKDWDICHSLGICYRFLKETSQAVKCFHEALTKTRHIVTYEALSNLYIEDGEIDKAMDVLKKGVEFAPENIDLLTSLGLLYLRKENFHRAFELLGQVLTCDPENYKAILAVSSLMQRHDDFDVALSKYRVAAHCVPESSSVWNNIGMCYFGKKKVVAAISCLKRAHYHSPFDWKILYNLSLVHLTTQQYVSAFHFASAAIALNPKHGPLFLLLAIALANLDQPENAQRAYEQAMTLSPDDLYLLVNYCIFLHNSSNDHLATSIMSSIQSKYPLNQMQKTDKEAADVCKKLAAALHLGDKIVAEKDKGEKKKAMKLSHGRVPGGSTSVPTDSSRSPRNESAKASSNQDQTPHESAGSVPMASPAKLPPLLPRMSLDEQDLDKSLAREAKKREKKEKRLAMASQLTPFL